MPQPALDVEKLSESLAVLASPARLRILLELRLPRTPAEVAVQATDERADLRAERTLSRTTVIHHLGVLESHGLVEREDDSGRFVLNRARLFLVTDALSALARIEPLVALEPGETVRREGPRPTSATEGPRLLHVGGPLDGRALPLAGKGPWTIGRAAEAHLRVDYDPQVSRRHASVSALGGSAFAVETLPEATNPLHVDGLFVPPGSRATLRAGSVLALGGTRLVLQPG